MSNIGKNQLVISGNRKIILDLFSNTRLNYTMYDINEINNNQFCVIFYMSLSEAITFVTAFAKKYSKITFKLFYADKLLSQACVITFDDNGMHLKSQNINLTLKEMKNDLLFAKAFKELL